MIPRNAHVGTNSTTLDASFGDPASIVVATDADTRICDFLAALRQPWWNDASCRGGDVSMFFDARRQADALQRCGSCVVMFECRTEAIADPHLDHGIRGGMTVNARQNSRRNRKDT